MDDIFSDPKDDAEKEGDSNIEWKKSGIDKHERLTLKINVREANLYNAAKANDLKAKNKARTPLDVPKGFKKVSRKIRDSMDEEEDEDDYILVPVFEDMRESSLMRALSEEEKKILQQNENINNVRLQENIGREAVIERAEKVVMQAGLGRADARVLNEERLKAGKVSVDEVVAEAVKQLQDEMPQYITFGMSHYYSEPKRVRFQSEGGKFIDADAIATAFAETTVLQDECEIQHLMGDIEDNREHRDPAKTPAVPIDELVRVTDERLATGNDEERSRAWLFALFDQLDDIAEATKNNLEPLVTALDTTLQNSSATIGNSATTDAGNSSNNANANDARSRIIFLIADALFPASESSQTSEPSASAALRELMLNPTATSLDYMPAIDVLRAHDLTICR